MNSETKSETPVGSDALFGLTVAVDFDGTCVTHEYPKVGRYIGAQPVLQRIVAEGGKLILWTMRSGQELQDAVDWFEAHGIPLYGIQRNPTQDAWTDSPKCYAKLYIDDAALGCPLLPGLKGERPFVDWKAISEILWPNDQGQPRGARREFPSEALPPVGCAALFAVGVR